MILSSIFAKRASPENPQTNLADPATWLHEAFGASPTVTGRTVTPKNVRQITAFFSAVATISDTLAELPIQLIRSRNGTRTVVTNHRVWNRLRNNPNPMMTDVTFRATLQGHVLTRGNGCAWIKRNRAREPREMWPLDADDTRARVIDGRLYYETKIDGASRRLPARDVLHIPAMSTNGVWGLSIIQEQREALAQALAVNEFGSQFFANGAKPSGLVSFPQKLRDAAKVKSEIEKATSGENAHSLLVLGGDAKYTRFAVPPDDAQFLQTKEFSVDEIGRMFRLPLHFLNKMGQATFNNLEMMGTHFVSYTMMPWLCRWEQELTRKLLTQPEIDAGYYFKFNVSALVRGDIKTRSEVYASGIQWGYLTRNEVRELEDRNAIEGLDDPLMPLNMVAVGQEPPEPPPESEAEVDEEDEEDERNIDVVRALIAQRAAAKRLVRNECNAIRRMMSGAAGDRWPGERNQEALDFYEQFVAQLQDWLGLDAEAARAYVIEHGEQLAKSRSVSETLTQWESQAVDRLLHQTRGTA